LTLTSRFIQWFLGGRGKKQNVNTSASLRCSFSFFCVNWINPAFDACVWVCFKIRSISRELLASSCLHREFPFICRDIQTVISDVRRYIRTVIGVWVRRRTTRTSTDFYLRSTIYDTTNNTIQNPKHS